MGGLVLLWAHAVAAKHKEIPGVAVPLIAFLCFAFDIAITVCLYVYYTYGDDRGGCTRNKTIISINLVLSVIMVVFGLLSQVDETRGLLQPLVLSAYTVYITWSAVSQTTDQ